MGTVELVDKTSVKVCATGKEDLAVLTAAFRASLGSDPQTFIEGTDDYIVSLENFGNIMALRACGFQWDTEALEAVVDKLMPMAYRRAIMRSIQSETESVGASRSKGGEQK